MKKLILFALCILYIPGSIFAITHTEKELELIENKYNPSYDGYVLLNGSDEQNELIQYARELSNDLDFILTIFAESGFRPNAVGDNGNSHGLCQWHRPSGRGWLLDNPNFQDGKRQIEQCWRSYQIRADRGQIRNRLYGYNVRLEYKHLFIKN